MKRRFCLAAFAALVVLVMPCPPVDASDSEATIEWSALTGSRQFQTVADAPDWSVITGPPELDLCGLACPVLERLISREELAGAQDEMGCGDRSKQQGFRGIMLSPLIVPSVLGTQYGGSPPQEVSLAAIDGRVVAAYVGWVPEGERRAMRVVKKVAKDVANRIGREPDTHGMRGNMSIWYSPETNPETATGVLRVENHVGVMWMCMSVALENREDLQHLFDMEGIVQADAGDLLSGADSELGVGPCGPG